MDLPTILDARGAPAVLRPQAAVVSTSGGHSLYEGSQDTDQRKWRPQVDRDVMDMLPHHRHRAMLSDARYIYSTGGGMVAGAVHRKADHAVGDAWEARYNGADPDFKRLAEPAIRDWMKVCDVRGRPFSFSRDVWLGSKSLDVDGDFFIVPIKGTGRGYPQLQFLEAHRIGQREMDDRVKGGRYNGKRIRCGVIYNDFGRPIAYKVLGDTPAQDRYLQAADVIHVFDPKWYSQGRGIPSVAYSILDWYDVSEIRNAEKIAVKANSKLAIIEKNEQGAKDVGRQLVSGTFAKGTGGIQSEVLADGLIRYIKAKGDISAHESNRPGTAWEGFMEHILRGAFLGLDWPIECVFDMSALGGASVRAVCSQAQRSVASRQKVLSDPMRSALLHGVAGLMDLGEIPMAADWWDWSFTTPARWSVDVGRDAQNARADYIIGHRTLTSILEEQGKELSTHLRERAREEVLKDEIAAEFGIDADRLGLPGANVNLFQDLDPDEDGVRNTGDAPPDDD